MHVPGIGLATSDTLHAGIVQGMGPCCHLAGRVLFLTSCQPCPLVCNRGTACVKPIGKLGPLLGRIGTIPDLEKSSTQPSAPANVLKGLTSAAYTLAALFDFAETSRVVADEKEGRAGARGTARAVLLSVVHAKSGTAVFGSQQKEKKQNQKLYPSACC